MLKALTIPVLALGLALGGTAKPAKALTAEETAALLAGIAIVGVIAATNNNKNKNRNRAHASARTPSGHISPRYSDHPRRWNPKALPAECLRRIETNRGIRILAGERCLERRGIRTARLPQVCEVRVRTDRGLRDAYRKRCLEREGFRFRESEGRRVLGRGDFQRDRQGRVILDARRYRD